MEIENSSLYREIQAVLNSPNKPVHFQWKAEIHVNGVTYHPLKVLSIDFAEDYETKYADEIIITLAISGGTYAKRIYPFKDKVDITLFRNPLQETAAVYDTEAGLSSERYAATLIDTGNPIVEGNGSNTPTEESLNLTNIFEISFQLVNKALEQMRMLSVGGVYRNTTTENVVKTILTNESKKVVVDGVRRPVGVDMFPASNMKVRDHVIIPQGTKLVSLPEYVQSKCGGVYSSGLGYYFKKDHWYIYPCYDTTRFNKAPNTLTIINVPRNKLPDVERTYRQDGKNIVIIATGDVKLRDDSESQQLNQGNGVRFADADTFMNGFSKTVNNKTVINRGKNNSEVIAASRASGNNNVHVSNNPINSNPFVEYSKLARRQGNFISLVWENSSPALILPGMMVRVLYMDSEGINDVYGVLLKAHHYAQTKGTGMTDMRYVTRSALSIFTQQIKE